MVAQLLDHSVGIAIESTYNTPVTVSRFYEWLPSGMDWDPMPLQGKGLRSTATRFARSGRRIPGIGIGKGTIKAEVVSKGFGLLFQAAFGTATSTLVSGSTYQQLFTPTQAATVLPSFTSQFGYVEGALAASAGGTVDPYTFAGCTVGALTLAAATGGILDATFDIDARSVATATALAAPSYPTTPTLYTFVGGAVTMAGAVTVPTTTALASGGTSVGNVKNFTFKMDNGIDRARWVLGGRNQPTTGLRKATLECDIEYTDTALIAAYVAQTALAVTLTFVTTTALSTGVESLQLTFPAVMINSGPIPQSADDKVIINKTTFEILDNLTAAQPIYMAVRTADAAL